MKRILPALGALMLVAEQVFAELADAGLSRKQARAAGVVVTTTIDRRATEAAVRSPMELPRDELRYSVDPASGGVRVGRGVGTQQGDRRSGHGVAEDRHGVRRGGVPSRCTAGGQVRDAWMAGYIPELATVVYVGGADAAKPVEGGAGALAQVWRSFREKPAS